MTCPEYNAAEGKCGVDGFKFDGGEAKFYPDHTLNKGGILPVDNFRGGRADAAEKIESSPTGDRIALDGDPSDWEGIPITYLEDSLHVASIAHDDDNLYLMFRFADGGLARQILMRGVTLWVNGDGKNRKKKEV